MKYMDQTKNNVISKLISTQLLTNDIFYMFPTYSITSGIDILSNPCGVAFDVAGRSFPDAQLTFWHLWLMC